jgi:3-oxoacyl-[acyl-carrier-protein] synthase II
VGVILGTGSGSLASQIDFILDVHRQESVEWINPLQFPQTVMNCAAGQVSIWHHFTGINATVSGGYHSGVSALEFADNALRQSRADHVLAGCAEEFSAYSRYLLPIDDRQLRRHHRLGEGCLMALVEPRNQDGRSAEVIGARRLASLARLGPHEGVSHLIGTIGELLASRSGLPDKFGLICYNRFSSREDEMAGAIAERFSSGAPEGLICSNDFVADCLAATSGLQLALLLALGPQGSDPLGLAVTFDPRGAAAVCIVEPGEE